MKFVLSLSALINLVCGQTLQSCDSMIYCQGELLDVVQRAGIFEDSKTFVDMTQVNPPSKTLENFETLKAETNNNPTKEDVKRFIGENFVDGEELEKWSPGDYKSEPAFLRKLNDRLYRDFSRKLVSIWPTLARKIKEDVAVNPEKHSLIPVPNGFVIPGGRFKELYYWDSYWIIKGLMISEMHTTARGMIENLMAFVEDYGYVPNGGRVYYLNRSQPPLLCLMVGLYIDATNDTKWLRKNIGTLEKELNWWLDNRTAEVEKNGVKYTLAHFGSASGTPRPESYVEDIKTCGGFEEESRKENCYRDIKGGAESGWDFSSRWIFDHDGGPNSNLTDIQTRRVAPVDLNAYLCKSLEELSRFYKKLGRPAKALHWKELATSWRKTIELVLYNKEDGIWYDYDIALSRPRKWFYPSNFAPLWAGSFAPALAGEYGSRAVAYFKKQGINEYRGGIPTSLRQSGEQWDYPNAWPPLQELIILGFKKSGNPEAVNVSKTFARRWLDANIRGYQEKNEMFEKYDAINSGQYGGGGEYTVQTGFGWTNGVALSIIDAFYVDHT